MISIHALVKSATLAAGAGVAVPLDFNPRAREERDNKFFVDIVLFKNFNPRAREERDRFFTPNNQSNGHFNPRAREERDAM